MRSDDVDPHPADRASTRRSLTARGERTRDRLLSAAASVFSTTPFAKVRLSDITAVAHVSAGSFYTYFDSKEEIFREIARDVLTEMSEAARLDVDELAEDPITALANATRRYFHVCLRNTVVARSMEQLTIADADVSRARRDTVVVGVKRVERWIRQLQISGQCDTEIDSWDTAMVLHTMNVRVAYDHLLLGGRPDDVERLVTAVTHVWARTLGLERPPTPPRVDPSARRGPTPHPPT